MLPLFDQIYVIASVVGFLFLTVGFVIGQMEHGGGESSDFGHADSDAGGDFSADSDAGGDFGSADSDAGGDFSSTDSSSTNQVAAGARANAAMRSGAGLHDKRERSLLLTLLKYLSPTTIATFLFCFGFSGIMFSRGLPFLGWLSMIPALIGGIVIYKLISKLLARITRSLYTSSNFREESLIGRMAETTCSIPYGRMGEITYKVGSIRHTAPARSFKEGVDISKTATVIISDIQDGVFYIEPCTYEID